MDRHEGKEIYATALSRLKEIDHPLTAIRAVLEFYEDAYNYQDGFPVFPVEHDTGAIAEIGLSALDDIEVQIVEVKPEDN